MGDDSTEAATQAVIDMFDEDAGAGVVCRVCGSLVAAADEYRRAHWAWHEAPNGA